MKAIWTTRIETHAARARLTGKKKVVAFIKSDEDGKWKLL
jgi:hypothetical protein